MASIPPRIQPLLTGWLVPGLSATAAIGLGLFLACRSHQVDIDVYLMGGRHALTGDLYSVYFGHPFLRFTYPPFAALLFLPLSRTLAVMPAQTVWAIVNICALFALIATSLRLVRPELDRGSVVRLSLASLLPALLLNPVFLTVGLGQVNLVLCVAVLVDLLGIRRIGRFTVPQGMATGVAAAVKLTPLIFLVYFVLTGRRRAAMTGSIAFVLCSGLAFAAAPRVSWSYWSRYVLDSKRAGALFDVSDQNLVSTLSRFDHAALTFSSLWPVLGLVAVAGLALATGAHRWSSPLLGVLVCATTGLLISPITWAHHLVWVLPAICWLTLADDRPRHGPSWALGTALLFWIAPIWWVPTSWWPKAHPIELTEGGWRLLAGNSFFVGMMTFLAAISVIVWRRRPSRSWGVSAGMRSVVTGTPPLTHNDVRGEPAR